MAVAISPVLSSPHFTRARQLSSTPHRRGKQDRRRQAIGALPPHPVFATNRSTGHPPSSARRRVPMVEARRTSTTTLQGASSLLVVAAHGAVVAFHLSVVARRTPSPPGCRAFVRSLRKGSVKLKLNELLNVRLLSAIATWSCTS